MSLSAKQKKAVEYVIANPGAPVESIVSAAGASTTGSNAAEFIWRMLSNGTLRLDVSPEVRDALEDGEI